jgi:hypothetical protein
MDDCHFSYITKLKKKKPWCQGFFLGEFSPLANKKIIIATHTKDFCEKKKC